MPAKIPATVVTGFLGAGKTTLIRHMLANANGKRIALIINEFGDLGVDGDILRGCGDETCRDEDIMELSNGCICCTVAEDFIPTMEKLLDREDRPDHIVIETSGLALPQPLVRAFNWPAISTRVTVDGVVTVVDGPAHFAGTFAHDVAAVDAQRAQDENLDHETPLSELFEDQLACADMIVVNKADLLGEEETGALVGKLRAESRDGVVNLAIRFQLRESQSGATSIDCSECLRFERILIDRGITIDQGVENTGHISSASGITEPVSDHEENAEGDDGGETNHEREVMEIIPSVPCLSPVNRI